MAKRRRSDDWISITQAAMILKVRYLRARDLASRGLLGDVERTATGRYYVRESAVRDYAASSSGDAPPGERTGS